MFNAETVETNYFIEGVKAYLSYIHERYRKMSLRRYGFFLCTYTFPFSVCSVSLVSLSMYIFLFSLCSVSLVSLSMHIFFFFSLCFVSLVSLYMYIFPFSLDVLFHLFLFFFLTIRYHFIIKVCPNSCTTMLCMRYFKVISSFLVNSKQNSLAFFPPRFIPFRPVR